MGGSEVPSEDIFKQRLADHQSGMVKMVFLGALRWS